MKLKTKGQIRELLVPTFIFLWLIMFLVEVVKSALLVSLLPVFMGSVLKLSTFAIGLSLSLQYIGDNFFRSFAGWLVERIGLRLTMLCGLIISTGAVALIAYGKHTGLIALGCTLLGVGTAPLWPCVLMGISSLTSKTHNFGTAMAIIQLSTLSGTGLGPVVINFLIGKSYRPIFWLLIGCMVIALILSLLLPGKRWNQANKGENVRPKEASLLSGGLGKWVHNVRVTFAEIRENLHVSPLIYPALFLQSFAVGILTPIITLYIRTVLKLPPAAFSGMLIVGGGITALGLIPVGKLVDKYGTKRFLNIGFAMAFFTILGFALTRSVPMVWGLVMGIGISYSFILPSWDTMVAKLLPAGEKGTVWGLFLTIQGCGMVLGPIFSGKLWDVFGPSAPFLASSFSMGALFFLHLALSRPRNSWEEGEEKSAISYHNKERA